MGLAVRCVMCEWRGSMLFCDSQTFRTCRCRDKGDDLHKLPSRVRTKP